MNQAVFKRHELKYLLSDWQRAMLEQGLQEYMQPDVYGQSTICSLYCDTPDYRLIRESVQKPVYKEKLRLRSYGQTAPEGEVFLELKKKYAGIVYKRRIRLPQPEAMAFLTQGAPLPGDDQISRELTWFRDFYGTLQPAVYLCYDRTAYTGLLDPSLRLTLDRSIRWRTTQLRLDARPGGQALLEPGQNLLEIKTADAMPMWLVHLLNACQLRQCSFSKYGGAYALLLQESLKESRGIICA